MMATPHKMKKKKHFKAVIQKVKLFRSNDPLLSVFMWGVSHTVNDLQHVNIPVLLMPDDFKAYTKVRIDNHLYNKENFPSHFKFKDYCPLVFRNLRERFGIDDNEYASALSVTPLQRSSPGRSGAKFFVSQNRKYYVKTIESEEVERLHNILPQYHHYIVEKHAVTLLPQYLGMYRTTVDGKETYLIVMKSVFGTRLKIHKKYDLKGSTIDRQASNKEKTKDLPTFKDNDFTRDNVKLIVGEDAKMSLMQIIKDDTEFLTQLNIMDYSLLVGIHDLDMAESGDDDEDDGVGEDSRLDSNEESDPDSPDLPDSPQDVEGPMSVTPPCTPPGLDRERTVSFGSNEIEGDMEDSRVYTIHSADETKREIYFLGIIDVLTYYGPGKKAAHAAKTVKHGSGADFSTVKPGTYAKRFQEFIDKIVVE